jgi:putative transposase
VSKGCSVSAVCKLLKRSRQSYYKAIKCERKAADESVLLTRLVQPIRHRMPRIGGRKLHYLIRDKLVESRAKIGRDTFFRWLKQNEMLIFPKRRYVNTTQSHHRFWVYENLTKDIKLTKPNQLWVSDITYVRTVEGFCYLALITDAYSRRIVGFDISDSLELEGCLRALQKALQTATDFSGLIHHSDRGIQYCSNQYTALLKKESIQISMAAKGNCYENALAERVNGILKNEFNLDANFKTKRHAVDAVTQSIKIYNEYRPHWSLNLQTPNMYHYLNN